MPVMTNAEYESWLYSCCRTVIVDGKFNLNGCDEGTSVCDLDSLVSMSIDGEKTGDDLYDKDTFVLLEPVRIDYEHIKLEYPFKSVRTGKVELRPIRGVVYLYPWCDAIKEQTKLLDLMRGDRNVALLHSKSDNKFNKIVAKWHLENTYDKK